jgi:hypothetical protein
MALPAENTSTGALAGRASGARMSLTLISARPVRAISKNNAIR